MKVTKRRSIPILGLLVLGAVVAGMARLGPLRMGRQPDGSFLVSSGQRIEGGSIAFTGRPIDLALHPREEVFAVLNKSEVFLVTAGGVRQGTSVPLGTEHHRGVSRASSGRPTAPRLYASTDRGYVQAFAYKDGKLHTGRQASSSSPRGPRATPSPAGWRSLATARAFSWPRPTATRSPRSTW